MMEMTARYNEAQYLPFNSLAKVHDYKMAAIYNDQQNRTMYYEYTQNQLRLKSLNNSDLSLNGDLIHSPSSSSTVSMQPRLHAYDYQLYNEQKYIPGDEHVYDSLRRDYPAVYADWNNPDFCYENASMYPRSKKKRDKGSTQSRSKSSERSRRKLSRVDNSHFWEGNAQIVDAYGNVCAIPINRSLSGNLYQARPCNGYSEEFEPYPQEIFDNMPQRVAYRSDSSHGKWQQWPWSARGGYCIPPVLSPSSPLDSGLSSQSIASSPSLEAEPIHMQRIPECGSPVPLASFQKNQCSCSTTSFPDPNIHSPPIRSDSGRSSPWTHAAVTKMNTLTRTKKHDIICDTPIFVDVVNSPNDFDPRRFSMSGIFISPRDKNFTQTSEKVFELENENSRTLRKKNRVREKEFVDGYEYMEREKAAQILSAKPETGTLRSKRFDQSQSQQAEDNTEDKTSSDLCNKESVREQHEKSPEPESPVSSPTSNNSTDISPSDQNKNNSESSKNNKKSSKQSEKAICELEEMYNKLNLQDYDLLDRAERRDLPTVHQDLRLRNGTKVPGLTRSKSDSFFEILGPNLCNPFKKPPRAPPLRRSGVIDRVADDMAIRKLQKPNSKPLQTNENSATYMLYSSHFTPSLSVPNDILLANRPDIEYDDLSYRRYFHMSSGKMSEPQPPFGIPLKPLPPQSIFSDYLHVVPSGIPPPICHPRGNPDLVRDDLAFRALRKDDPERALYDSYSLFYRKIR